MHDVDKTKLGIKHIIIIHHQHLQCWWRGGSVDRRSQLLKQLLKVRLNEEDKGRAGIGVRAPGSRCGARRRQLGGRLTLSSTTKNWFRRPFSNKVKIDQIAQQVIKVRDQVEGKYGEIMKTLETINNGDDDGPDEEKKNPEAQDFPLREKRVVDVKDKADTIIRYLQEDKQYPDIISIVGPPGLGKSTLAGSIFRHPTIEEEFPERIWVNVSKYTPKEVFLRILKEVMTDTKDEETDNNKQDRSERGKLSRVASKMQRVNKRVLGIKRVQDHRERGSFSYNKMQKMSESELEQLVKKHLKRGKFLIVMDDVYMGDDWEKISNALPTSNELCKILVTSRERVAMSPNKDREPLDMRPLSKEESIELLQYEVFGEKTWPKPEYRDHGEVIADKCKGLPLAVVVMGGIIHKKLSLIKDHGEKLNAWNAFSEKVHEYLSDDSEGTMEKVISLSYDRLPYHLRPCFLYFGMFPEDAKIPTWKLFQMWIAEGFIPESTHFTKEETAEIYLDELIIRSLVMVDKTSFDGKVKLVRIHNSLRDFCLKKAGKDREKFLQEIRELNDGSLNPLVKNDNEYLRLAIHSNISKFLSSKPSSRRVRSFVCSSKGHLALKGKHLSAISKGFKVLRILDVNPVTFPKIPPDMYDLLHLRYVHLSFNSRTLPPSFSNLWNMQTLIVSTSRRTLKIQADIWKMRHLKNLKTNATTNLPKVTEASEGCRNNLQTLGKIAPENCTSEVLDRASNLRRVSIRGNLNVLRAGTIDGGCLFDHMVKMSKLQELKLENDAFPLPPSECPLRYLPPADTFPPNLRKLTLSGTRLNWTQMTVLAFLDNLKLKESAFAGNFWETVGGFKSLQVLFIGRTDLVVWKSSAGHFPALVCLELYNCEYLRDVPIELAETQSFGAMELNHCPTAKNIEMKKKTSQKFKLTIFPPVNN